MTKTCNKPVKTEAVSQTAVPQAIAKISGPTRIGQIRSDEGLEKTLTVLQNVSYEASCLMFHVQGEANRLQQHARSAVIEIIGEDGEQKTVELWKYMGQLVKAVEDYGFRMGSLTMENGSGRVARRSTPARVAFIPQPEKEDDPDGKSSEKAGEKASIKRVMEMIGKNLADLLKKFGLNRFWKIEIKPDITSAKAALQRHEVTAAELEEQGMHVVPEEQRVDISVTGSDLKKVLAFYGE